MLDSQCKCWIHRFELECIRVLTHVASYVALKLCVDCLLQITTLQKTRQQSSVPKFDNLFNMLTSNSLTNPQEKSEGVETKGLYNSCNVIETQNQ